MNKQNQDEDPPLTLVDPDKVMVIFTIVSIITFIIFILIFGTAKIKSSKPEVNLSSCFLVANLPHNVILIEPRAMLIKKIIWCESKDDPTAKNPKSTAYGICQFIDGTWEYVQEKWDMKLDRDNYYDQYYACERLLKEEGVKHWKSSKRCWSK